MKRLLGIGVLLFGLLGALYVAGQAVQTLDVLANVERERDTWQRPDEVLRALDLRPGSVVVDFGSGAGYFALKIAPRVAPGGRVLAVDLRRQSLAFLWIRAVLSGQRNLTVIRSRPHDPELPAGQVDAVLIANTYHELTEPEPILAALFSAMRQGARLVVVDRAPRRGATAGEAAGEHHEIAAAAAEREITARGFEIVSRDDRFIDRPGDEDVWWMTVFRRP